MIQQYFFSLIVCFCIGTFDYWFKDHVFKHEGDNLWWSLGWGILCWGSAIALLIYFLHWHALLFVWMILTEDMTYYLWDSIEELVEAGKWHFNKTFYLPCKMPFGYNEGRTEMPMKSVLWFWLFTVIQGLLISIVSPS